MAPKRRYSRSSASSTRPLRPGPATLAELDSWPLDIVTSLLGPCFLDHQVRRSRVAAYFSHWRFFFCGDYSGIECCREVMRLLTCALSICFPDMDRFDWQWTRSCDFGAPQFKYLVRYSHEVEAAKGCVLHDMNDRLSVEAWEHLNRLEPNEHDSSLACICAYEDMFRYLEQNLDTAFEESAQCYVHDKKCIAHPGCHHEFDPLTDMCWDFAGTTCVGWSSMGKQRGFADPSERTHAIWLAERIKRGRSRREAGFFQECTIRYPVVRKLRAPLAVSHRVVFVIADPGKQGRSFQKTKTYKQCNRPPHEPHATAELGSELGDVDLVRPLFRR